MNKELLEKYLEDGLTHREIAQLTGKSKSTVGYWISKYDDVHWTLIYETGI